MGAGVSNWLLARTVSSLGQLGVVSGTALDIIMVRRLQDGDIGGHVRRALESFPFPDMARKIIDSYFVPDGRKAEKPYGTVSMHSAETPRQVQELCIAANFVEVFLAREGHDNPVGINYLEKIQFPHLASIYGAMLAGVSVIIMGAGIPREIPGVLDALTEHRSATYSVRLLDAPAGECITCRFDPAEFGGTALPTLDRPKFFPIVSSDILATLLLKRSTGRIDGFVVEGPTAGGHNAPPRGPLKLDASGQPVYGSRDVASLEAMSKLGLPFWVAGSYGSAPRLAEALAEGAAGIQVGTAFALCEESGLAPDHKAALIRRALEGRATVKTDPLASPTGFPFKVAALEGSLSEAEVYAARSRICDLGYLREAYKKTDGTIGYRCAAEPEAAYLAKGGRIEDMSGRKCLCNALMANIGLSQVRPDGYVELPLVTCGDDLSGIGRFCSLEKPTYTARDVIDILLS